MKKNIVFFGLIFISLVGIVLIGINSKNDDKVDDAPDVEENVTVIKNITYGTDRNKNGIDDMVDIVDGARKEVQNETHYESNYYQGGYPPEGEGVCTDVVWRAFKCAGINLKDQMDQDIKANPKDYRDGVVKADPNIDFRRVKNQKVFFKKYYNSLTTKIDLDDQENLKQWQPGDIVVKDQGDHVAILSDKRDKKGVPYVLHNFYNHATEDNSLYDWYKEDKIIGHYRLKYN